MGEHESGNYSGEIRLCILSWSHRELLGIMRTLSAMSVTDQMKDRQSGVVSKDIIRAL